MESVQGISSLRWTVKIRILHVIATLDPAGAENQLTRLVLNLDKARFSPLVCCLTRGGPLEEKLARGGVPYRILYKQGKCDPVALLKLTALMRRFRPHVVHTWMFTSNAYGRTAAILAGAPIRVSTELSVDEWKWGPYRLVDRLLLWFTDAVIANAEAVKNFYVNRERVPPSKISLIRNGIALNVFQPRPKQEARKRLGIPPAAQVIGGAGRLDPQKGFSFLLEAMPEVRKRRPDAMLVIAGEGAERGTLEGLAARLGLRDCVKLIGRTEDMAGFMSSLDLFALPSVWEGLPHVVMEAMACGCPVVAARVGGVSELIAEGVTGITVQPQCPKALAEGIVALLEDDRARLGMGRKAHEVAQRDFDFMEMVRQTEELYLLLMERRGVCVGS